MDYWTPPVHGFDGMVPLPKRAWGRCGVMALLLLGLVMAPYVGAVTPGAAGVLTPVADTGGSPRATLAASIKEVPAGLQPTIAGTGTANAAEARVTRTNLRPAEMNALMPFTVSLKLRNVPELQARVARGEIISSSEMAQKYWPLASDYDATARWLRQQGFTLSPESGAALLIASGTVAQVQNAFQVTFARVANADGEFTSAVTAPSVPAALAPALVGINGLQPHLRKHPKLVHPQAQPDSTGALGSTPYIPRDIATAYGANTLTQTGAGQTIAIIMSGYPQTSDLTKFWSVCNVTQTLGNVSFVNVNAGPTATKNSVDVEEASLDVEWSSSLAPAAHIRLYGTPSLSNADLDTAYQQVYNDVVAHPEFGLHILSLSYGGGETSSTSAQLTADDNLLLQLASAGVTVFAATGDNGSAPGGSLSVETPACDPNVTGVGGTSITMNSSAVVTSETTWSGSGGGTSVFFAKPAWQTGGTVPGVVVISPSPGVYEGLANRLLPDVSAPADPNTGCLIRFNGANTTVGGTSWSTPTWAGFAALINQARVAKNAAPLGLLGPKIYPLQNSAVFRDIVSGNIGGYGAGPGYDLASGLGVPVFPALFLQLTTILEAPQNVTVNAGQAAGFSALPANGVSAIKWQRMGVNTSTWANLTDNLTYAGTATQTLTVNATTADMSGDQFRCVFDGVASPAATLVVVNPQYFLTTFAGQTGTAGTASGRGNSAQFDLPNDVALDSGGNIFVADTGGSDVRKITPDGNVTLYAGTPGATGTTNGGALSALFNFNNALDVDSAGNVFVADSNNNAIREILANGTVTTFAGSSFGVPGSSNGAGTNAGFNFPSGIAVDSGGNIYVADSYNNLIRKISPGGNVTTLAGQTTAGFADGNGTSALFNAPQSLAVDAAKNVYVADTNNNVIRKITPAGNVTTFAGSALAAGVADGTGANARFNYPGGIAVDNAGNLYVADTNSHSIRKITSAGVVTTIAGSAGNPGTADGFGSAAQFNQPYGVVAANSSVLYIADTFNDTVRKAILVAAPILQTQPGNQTVPPGASAQFTVVASGSPAPAFQWQRFPAGGGDWANLTDDATYNGTATATLTVTRATGSMNGDQFRCSISSGAGSVISNAATLVVESPPVFTIQPAGQIILAGGTANFAVSATGFPDAISYQWQMFTAGTATWVNLSDNDTFSGTATPALTITSAASSLDGSQFRCVASNGISPDAISNAAPLTVQYLPSFQSQPAANQTVTAGNQAVFSVTVNGNPGPTLQWQRLANGGSTWANLTNNSAYSGVTSTTLTINATAGMNGDQFRVLIGNSVGNLNSNTAILTVWSPPVFTLQPADQQASVGSPALFAVAATAFPNTIVYQWQILPAGTSVWATLAEDTNFNGTTTASLTINAVTFAMDGSQFRCVASNGISPDTASTAATLAIETGPALTTQPRDQTSIVGGTAIFALTASGLPVPSFQWQRLASGGASWENLTDDGIYNGTATASLAINGTTTAMDGDQFRCFVSNFLGNLTSISATLSIQFSPAFTLQPVGQVTVPGGSASFGAAAVGVPVPGYQWQILSAGGTAWSNLEDGALFGGTTTPQLTVLSAALYLHGSQFRCVASNGVNPDAISNAAVLLEQGPPVIVTQPSPQIVLAGNGAAFSTAAAGFPAPYYQWQRLPAGNSTWANLTDSATYHGSAAATLIVNATTTAMTGDQFRCVASNGAPPDAVSDAVSLAVQVLPIFTKSPTTVIATAGTSAVFAASATGVPSPTFQWQRFPAGGGTWANMTDGSPYTGTAAASLTINPTTVAMNGDQFRVIISNAAGNLTSSAATLTMQAPPAFTIQPGSKIVSVGNPAVFASLASGLPPPTFQWQRLPSGSSTWANLSDGATYNGSISATLTVNATTFAMAGDQFRVVINNTLGSVTSNSATLGIQSPPGFSIQPSSQTAITGNAAVFTASATGTPPPAYQWQRLPAGNGTWANLTDGATYNGSATATLTVNATTVAMNGDQFRLFTSNAAGSATSQAATLSIQAPVAIVTQPTAQTTLAGSTATFTANVSGLPVPSFQWQRLPGGNGTWVNLTDTANYAGTATATLTVNATSLAMNGDKFRLMVSNSINSQTSAVVALTVQAPPSITSQPGSLIVLVGQKAVFLVAASGNPNPTFQWRIKPSVGGTFTSPRNGNSSVTITNGTGSSTLAVNNATLTMDGSQYECVASNTINSFNSTVTSQIATLTIAKAPALFPQPATENVTLGQPAVFNVTLVPNTGIPAPTYQWQRQVGGSGNFVNLTDNATFHGSLTPNLILNATTPDMNGDRYQCFVSNELGNVSVGNVTSNGETLNLTEAPVFSTQPVSQVITAGNSTTFTVAASGLPTAISYQWQMLAAGGSTWSNLTGSTGTFTGGNTATLAVNGPTVSLSGAQFRCMATNGISPGALSASAALTVVPPGYLTWAAGLNLSGASLQPSALAFGDPIPNLARFAMNLGAAPTPDQLPNVGTQMVNNSPYLVLQYNQLKALAGVSLIAQYSYDLVTWQTVTTGGIVVQLADPNAQTSQFQASVAIPANGTVFLRLVVQPAP